MSDEDVLAALADARAAYDADLEAVAELDPDRQEIVDGWHVLPDPAMTFEVECDETVPKLTDDEWAYVLEVSGG